MIDPPTKSLPGAGLICESSSGGVPAGVRSAYAGEMFPVREPIARLRPLPGASPPAGPRRPHPCGE